MEIAVHLISRWFAMTAVRRASVVVDVGVLRHYSWESAFIDVPGREIGISEVARFIQIVQFEIQRLGEGVICSIL